MKMEVRSSSILLVLTGVMMGVMLRGEHLMCRADPTYGFTEVPLTERNFELQKPYNIPLDQRYSFVDGIRTLWVYADDKPHNPSSNTKPRTEIRICGLDYSSGLWQFEGTAYVPSGTSGVTITQIHGAAKGATTFMLRVYNGDLTYYRSNVVATNVYDQWMRINVIHDVDAGKVTLFLNGTQIFEVNDHGPGDLYFKCGVYAQDNASHCMESRWTDIKIYRK